MDGGSVAGVPDFGVEGGSREGPASEDVSGSSEMVERDGEARLEGAAEAEGVVDEEGF